MKGDVNQLGHEDSHEYTRLAGHLTFSKSVPRCPRPEPQKVWSEDQQLQYHLSACGKCRSPGSTQNLLEQNSGVYEQGVRVFRGFQFLLLSVVKSESPCLDPFLGAK